MTAELLLFIVSLGLSWGLASWTMARIRLTSRGTLKMMVLRALVMSHKFRTSLFRMPERMT
jgi:hypothetical protein